MYFLFKPLLVLSPVRLLIRHTASFLFVFPLLLYCPEHYTSTLTLEGFGEDCTIMSELMHFDGGKEGVVGRTETPPQRLL